MIVITTNKTDIFFLRIITEKIKIIPIKNNTNNNIIIIMIKHHKSYYTSPETSVLIGRFNRQLLESIDLFRLHCNDTILRKPPHKSVYTLTNLQRYTYAHTFLSIHANITRCYTRQSCDHLNVLWSGSCCGVRRSAAQHHYQTHSTQQQWKRLHNDRFAQNSFQWLLLWLLILFSVACKRAPWANEGRNDRHLTRENIMLIMTTMTNDRNSQHKEGKRGR